MYYFVGDGIRNLDLQEPICVRQIFTIHLEVYEYFEERRCGMSGAIEDTLPFGMPTTGGVQASKAVEAFIVADAPELHV